MSETKGEMFAGLTVAIVTPFKDGEVDEAGLRKLVDWHIDQGTHCLAPVGTTGKVPHCRTPNTNGSSKLSANKPPEKSR